MADDRADFELELEAIELTDFAAEDHEHNVDAERIDTELQQYLTTDEGMDAYNDAKENGMQMPVKTEATPTTFDGYLHAVYACPALASGDWRLGQTFFNILHTIRPDLANKLRDCAEWADPYYDDHKIPLFVAYIAERW